MNKILLIGGAGFIGHNLALSLKKSSYDVEIIDNLQINNLYHFQKSDIDNKNIYMNFINQRLEYLRKSKIPLHEFDARNYEDLKTKIKSIKPDIVIHFAAVAHANKSNKDPHTSFDNSFLTLENSLDASRGLVKHFIYFSSSMVYGNFLTGSVTEDSICEPLGIYGALKYAGEKIVIAYNQVFDLPYTIIRPSALYGPRCVSRRVGQIFIENAILNKPININGTGEEKLDFTYIADLVQGVRKVIENSNSLNQTFNLTFGEGRKVNDMVKILKNEFPELEVNYLPKEKLMPDRGTLSVQKAINMIGYNPGYPIDKGYLDYIKWYKEIKINEMR